MADVKPVADLQGIKEVVSAPVTPNLVQGKVYEIPMYKTMKNKAGEDVDVLVQVIKTTKAQLQQAITQANARIAQSQAEVAELQGKLDAITALEG